VEALPVVDLSAGTATAAPAIDRACREVGFFYVVGHGVDPDLQASLETAARDLFARPDEEKAAIAMPLSGRAWRGWFPVGAELTSGMPDVKEGVYFGAEEPPSDVPLHGPNLWPAEPSGLRDAVLAWLDAMTGLGHRLCEALAVALGLDADWFRRHLTADPTILFRIFHYPPAPEDWGVGEHTDYGLLTILLQDRNGGLQVRTPAGWVDAPPVEGSFVCNVGDMLDRMTAGRWRSTPHRVRNRSGTDRVSFPFFFDPSWDAEVRPLPLPDPPPGDDADTRWDGTSVHAWSGTYGDYLLAKVAKVFPDLGEQVL
jgi:isopenicillin N synthase-like dioxygenase